MSKSRRLKKYNRLFDYETKGGTHVFYGGVVSELEVRIDKRLDNIFETGYGYLEPAYGVKCHVPRSSYVPYKGRKQLPRDYYTAKRNRRHK